MTYLLAILLAKQAVSTEIVISRLNLNRREIWLLSSQRSPKLLTWITVGVNDNLYNDMRLALSRKRNRLASIRCTEGETWSQFDIREISLDGAIVDKWSCRLSNVNGTILFGYDSKDTLAVVYGNSKGSYYSVRKSNTTKLSSFKESLSLEPYWSRLASFDDSSRTLSLSMDPKFGWGLSLNGEMIVANGKEGDVLLRSFVKTGWVMNAVPAEYPNAFISIDESNGFRPSLYSPGARMGIYMADFIEHRMVRLLDGSYVICINGGDQTPRDM